MNKFERLSSRRAAKVGGSRLYVSKYMGDIYRDLGLRRDGRITNRLGVIMICVNRYEILNRYGFWWFLMIFQKITYTYTYRWFKFFLNRYGFLGVFFVTIYGYRVETLDCTIVVPNLRFLFTKIPIFSVKIFVIFVMFSKFLTVIFLDKSVGYK